MTPGLGIPCSILLSYGRTPTGLYGPVGGCGKLARRALLVTLATGLVASEPLELRARETGPPVDTKATATPVVEGPTRLRLPDGRSARLAGLVVPGELSPAPDGAYRVAAARARLEAALRAGPLDFEVTGTDRTGRLSVLARTASGQLLQEVLLEEGLAWAFPDGLAPAVGHTLLAAEAAARAAGRGLWAEPALAVQDAGTVRASPPRFAVVEGTIVSVGRSESFTWLNFGPERRRDFTVRIAAAAVRILRRAGLRVEELGGRRVRVRGWLFAGGGAMMELDDPLQIEVLE